MIDADTTPTGLLWGMLVLAATWWAWAAYAWLTNEADTHLARVRVTMAAQLIAALAIPTAFTGHGLLFGGAYLVVRALIPLALTTPALTTLAGLATVLVAAVAIAATPARRP